MKIHLTIKRKKGIKHMKNENYLCLGGKKIEIPADKLVEIKNALQRKPPVSLEEMENGETIAHVGKYDFLVLERSGDTIAMVLKGLYREKIKFGPNNDYRGSNVQKICREFAEEIAAIVGEENLVEHTVDLTSDDGLKDYGKIKERVSLLTTELCRRYVDVLDLDRLQKYWWLATPYSTPKHEDSNWIKCVSPRGYVDIGNCYVDGGGVRPFCILKSDIFLS